MMEKHPPKTKRIRKAKSQPVAELSIKINTFFKPIGTETPGTIESESRGDKITIKFNQDQGQDDKPDLNRTGQDPHQFNFDTCNC